MQYETHTIPRRRIRPASATRRRVALFTGAYNHIADGVSLTLNRLVSYLESRDTEALIFAPTIANPPVEHAGILAPVPSIPVPQRSEYRLSLGLTPNARSLLKTFRPHLFHIATPDLLGYQALRFAERAGVPAVASYHTHFSSYLRYYGFGRLEARSWQYLRRFYDRCRHVYVPSESMAEALRSRGVEKGVRLWTRGVDTHRFNPARYDETWRRSIGVQDDAPIVSFIGRVVREKGVHIFAEVVRNLEEQGVRHRSMIVGDGPVLDDLRRQLPRTIFTGRLENGQLGRAYASSDVFLFPSDTETFGNVTLEAMASGLPAVCADATGSRTLVEHGETGLLIPPGDVRAFAQAVRHLIRREPERRRMGAAARERASAYDWNAVMARMVRYYDEALYPEAPWAGDGYAGDGYPDNVLEAPPSQAIRAL